MKKSLFIFLCAALVFGTLSFPVTQAEAEDSPEAVLYEAAGSDEPEPESTLETAEGYLLTDRPAPEGFKVLAADDSGLYGSASVLPASYTSPSVTSIKDQDPYGTCWAFSTVGSGESELVKNNGEDINTLDLSETQLAYFTYHSMTDPLGGLAGDSITLPAGENFLDAGGNRLVSGFVLASWVGLTPESATSPVTYSTVNSTTTLPSNLAYGANYATLRNALWIDPTDSNAIKQNIISYGAVSTSYYHDDNYYNGATGAYCNDEDYSTNHAVIIVGWDDNYGAANFNASHLPKTNGAWLVKNSWGSSFGIGGYFWMSYEDLSFTEDSDNYCVVYDMDRNSDYLHNYQYDGNGSLSYLTLNTDTAYMANIFTAAADERIKSVMFTTMNPNANYSIQVYLNPTPGNPTSGTACLDTPATGSVMYEGCYTIDLPKYVRLRTGDTFSVVVKLSDSVYAVALPVDKSKNWPWVTMIGSAQPGQSFVSYTGTKWEDIDTRFDANVRVKALTVKDDTIPVSISCAKTDATLLGAANGTITISASGGNSGIYEYSVNNGASWQRSNSFNSLSAGSYTAVVRDADNTRNIASCGVSIGEPPRVGTVAANKAPSKVSAGTAMTFTPPTPPKGYTVQSTTFTSSNPGIASIDGNGNITFLAGGKVTIITKVTAQMTDKKGRVKTKTTTVKKTITVQQPVSTISLSLANATIARTQKVTLGAAVAPGTATNKKLKWTSNNPKVAAVSGAGVVTGKAGGTAVITCSATDGSGVSASCTVTVTPVYPASVKLSKAALTIKTGKAAALKAIVAPKNTDFKTVTWSSSNPAVASVDAKGKIKGNAPGTAVITVVTSNGLSAACTVTVQ